ncbi:WD40-repeat-containing domain protein [Hygrophoropsis aurantiaca]|uniref:WD40-repeat-containing domain protein n=1 Tax=Hygrophoropsis aurantiaca TaxID=72124 RepID=A0ACB7ZTP7_9AGAM|nr:WD40-repeat-containing domain protein [Hygrophoropsis aurantiaca]
MDSFNLLHTFSGFGSAINSLDFSLDHQYLASGDDDNYCRIIDFRKAKEVCRLRLTSRVTSVLWHPAKSEVLFVGTALGSIIIATISENQRITLSATLATGIKAPVDAMVCSSSTGRLAVAVGTEVVTYHRPEEDTWSFGSNLPPPPNRQSGLTIAIPRSVHLIALGSTLIVAYFEHGIVGWALRNRKLLWHIHSRSRIGCSAVSPTEKFIVVSNLYNGFDQYDIQDGSWMRTYSTPITENIILPVIFADQGHTIILGSPCGFVMICRANSNEFLQGLRHAYTDNIQTLAYCDHGDRYIATASTKPNEKNRVFIWRAPRREPIDDSVNDDECPDDNLQGPDRGNASIYAWIVLIPAIMIVYYMYH